jgi:hypothetical protein
MCNSLEDIICNCFCESLKTDSSPRNRQKAAQELGELGNDNAIPCLIEASEDPNEDVRFSAMEALGKIAGARQFKALIDTLRQMIRTMAEESGKSQVFNIGNINMPSGNINIGGDQISHQHNHPPQRDFSEDIAEITQILQQLGIDYPPAPLAGDSQEAFVTAVEQEIPQSSPLRGVFIAGGIELIKVLCPPLGIPIEMGRKWLEAAQGANQEPPSE